MNPEPPGHRSWIIDMRVPWIIIVSCPIDYYSTVHITMSISGEVTHIYHFRRGLVNVCIFHIVNRGFRWQVVHFIRPFNAYFPGTGGFFRHKPDSIVNTIVYSLY